ncbi:hypothetical protein [Sandaracinus amylolyticus]|nr:hypothetical protein [Sandaracinus amylolyticus]
MNTRWCLSLLVVVLGGCADAGTPSGRAGSRTNDAAVPATDAATGLQDAADVDGSISASGERCGNGLDDDDDGAIDESCSCALGETQPCHPDRAVAGIGACAHGEQTCEVTGEFGVFGECTGAVAPTDEICGNQIDENCDGVPDDACPTIVEVDVDLDGDCLTASCPAEAPYPVGCDIVMDGRDPRGCVASDPMQPVVYFQEGDACGSGHVSGTLSCSSEPGAGLSETSCMINKSTRYYPRDRGGCPDT